MSNPSNRLGFWGTIPRPIFVLAPMADVTDAAFRYIIAKYGKPSVLMTEFVSVDGLCSRGRETLIRTLKFDEIERPVVAQFFGEKPENFYACAQLAAELGFDGIDINMGCPVKTVVKTGSGAALIKTPELAKEIVRETVRGAGGLPVSVKTRIGYNKIVVEEWVSHLLEAEPALITLHLRTAKEMSLVDAHWEVIDRAVDLIRKTDTLILGNGDVKNMAQARALVAEKKIDGIMFGRAIFGNPWLFAEERTPDALDIDHRFSVMMEHAHLYLKMFEGKKNFAIMQKHLRAYVSGFTGAKELRIRMEGMKTIEELEEILNRFRSELANSPSPADQ
jgi:nifR3 family TIM-barrel protein